jgi:RimJ/RimL family protein N-acetyltransferase
MSALWRLCTPRLHLTPVNGADLPDLIALKADPRVFTMMLDGVRTPQQAMEELASDVAAWGAEGFGLWAVRERDTTAFAGITGLQRRADGRGIALRFALWPEAQGRGLAREAAGTALRFGHAEVGLDRIIAVARTDNFASRTVLGSIGMRECERFRRNGWPMVMYESLSRSPGSAAPGGASR